MDELRQVLEDRTRDQDNPWQAINTSAEWQIIQVTPGEETLCGQRYTLLACSVWSNADWLGMEVLKGEMNLILSVVTGTEEEVRQALSEADSQKETETLLLNTASGRELSVEMELEALDQEPDYLAVEQIRVYENGRLLQTIGAEDVWYTGYHGFDGLFVFHGTSLGEPDLRDLNFDGSTDLGLLSNGGYRANEGGGPIPGQEAQSGGHHAQVHRIAQHHRLGKPGQIKGDAGTQAEGEGKEDTPEKDLPGDQQIVEALTLGGLQTQTVDAPTDSGAQGQQTADGVEVKGFPLRQGDEGDTCHGENKAHKEGGSRPGGSTAQPQQRRGKHGCGGDDEAYGGGHGKGEGVILQQRVEGEPRQGGAQERQLRSETAGQMGLWSTEKENGPGQHKAEDEDLYRMEGIQKHLGGDIGGTPHNGDSQGQQMAKGGRTAQSHAPFWFNRKKHPAC